MNSTKWIALNINFSIILMIGVLFFPNESIYSLYALLFMINEWSRVAIFSMIHEGLKVNTRVSVVTEAVSTITSIIAIIALIVVVSATLVTLGIKSIIALVFLTLILMALLFFLPLVIIEI